VFWHPQDQVDILKEVIQVLKPLEEMTRELCFKKNISISKIVPMLFCLQKLLQDLCVKSAIAIELRDDFLSNLSKRFGSFLNNDLCLMATVLDPRYKTLNFENNKTVVKQCLQKIKTAVLESFEVETSLSSIDDEVEECEASGSSLWNVQREILKHKPAQQNVKKNVWSLWSSPNISKYAPT
jgi:hypothetical protein